MELGRPLGRLDLGTSTPGEVWTFVLILEVHPHPHPPFPCQRLPRSFIQDLDLTNPFDLAITPY